MNLINVGFLNHTLKNNIEEFVPDKNKNCAFKKILPIFKNLISVISYLMSVREHVFSGAQKPLKSRWKISEKVSQSREGSQLHCA
jgi:hypothetical protein